jgi:hypothetical protein
MWALPVSGKEIWEFVLSKLYIYTEFKSGRASLWHKIYGFGSWSKFSHGINKCVNIVDGFLLANWVLFYFRGHLLGLPRCHLQI